MAERRPLRKPRRGFWRIGRSVALTRLNQAALLFSGAMEWSVPRRPALLPAGFVKRCLPTVRADTGGRPFFVPASRSHVKMIEFTPTTNDPRSARCNRHDGQTSSIGDAQRSHRSHRELTAEQSGRPMSTPSGEARGQCATRLRILHRRGPAPRMQRYRADEDRC
jgi:hypothetical protein